MSYLDSLLEDLLTSLDRETALYQNLLLILQREKQAVVGLAFDDLNESNKEKETLILQARAFEEARLVLSERLAEQLKIPAHKLTLLHLSDAVEEPYSAKLKTYRSNLLSLLSSIQEINRVNETLIAHSLDCFTGSLSLLTSLVSSGSTYLDTGRLQQVSRHGKLVRGKV
ncbi:MAG: flagellar protein FlgN [Pseudomonadota bacterium]